MRRRCQDLLKIGRKQESAEILDRIVAIEPTQANLQRVAEWRRNWEIERHPREPFSGLRS